VVAATFKQDDLLPRPPGGNVPGAALAVAVHMALIGALALGVNWRTNAPDVVSAELWAAVPQSAAPPLPPPAPAPAPAPTPAPAPAPPPPVAEKPPPAPDIALERQKAAEQKKLEQKKEEDERKKKEKAAADKKAAEEKAAEERINKQREENLRRMMAQAGSTPDTKGVSGSAAVDAAPSATYLGRIKAAIQPNIVFTERLAGNSAAEVEVRAAPGGSIISRKLIKSSGNNEWDEAVLRAIDKTNTLPRDTNGRTPGTLIITFRPNE
jgi:colicin import membrane protein